MLEEFLFNHNRYFHLDFLKELDNRIENAFVTVKLSNMFGEINYACPPVLESYYEMRSRQLYGLDSNRYYRRRSGKQC